MAEKIEARKKISYSQAIAIAQRLPNLSGDPVNGGYWFIAGNFYLQANPTNNKFDPRYALKLEPWTPYFLNHKDGSKDIKIIARFSLDFKGKDPSIDGCIPLSLLTYGKRPQRLHVEIDTHCDGVKAWKSCLDDYLIQLVNAGYNFIPPRNTPIAEIKAHANRVDSHTEPDGEGKSIRNKILTICPEAITIHKRSFFGNAIITDKVHRSIVDLVV